MVRYPSAPRDNWGLVIAFVAGAGTALLSEMVIAWIRTTLNM